MKSLLVICSLVMLFLGLNSTLYGQENKTTEKEKKLNLYGDFRFRTEFDRNSKKADGSERDDRDRLRYRLRFGFSYNFNKNIEFGGRIRSGNPMNQQSPHVTLGKEFHSDEFSIDKAYIKVKSSNGLWAWVGKNGMPFWEQNELLWDGDVNPEGIALGGKFKLGEKSNLEPIAGVFIVGQSGQNFSDDSSLLLLQLKLNSSIGDDELILSSGIIKGKDLPNTPDGTHIFVIDYSIWASSLQYNIKSVGLKLGLDYFNNLEDYDNDDDIADVYEDQKTGFVGSVLYGVKDWQFGYYYAKIEKFATVDYLAQDDWVRWGNSDYTRSSNFKGHEFRIKYNIAKNFNTVLRAYFVEGIETTGVNLETGTRVRLDFNIKF